MAIQTNPSSSYSYGGYGAGTFTSNGSFNITSYIVDNNATATQFNVGDAVTYYFGDAGADPAIYKGYYLDGTVERPLVYDTADGEYILLGVSSVNQNYTILQAPDNQTSPTCYTKGTQIRTVHGDIAVEHLSVGDLVLTASGERRAIRWLGHRKIDCRRHLRHQDIHPARITAGAFGPSKPARDLFVSPAHAIYVDLRGGVLIPAAALVNGTTVQQIAVDTVDYWHVELDSHDILLAENLPAESYLEMDNRGFFAEASVVELAAIPDAAVRTHADFCRPFHEKGPLVEVVRAELRSRALALGWMLDDGDAFADLHLMVGGVRIDPTIRGAVAGFAVPGDAQDIQLVSRTARACDLGETGDGRDLGVCLGGLAINDGFDVTQLDLADPRLMDGFHDFEAGGERWTNGLARLPSSLWAHCANGFFLRVDLAGPALPRWVAPAETLKHVQLGT